MNGLNVDVPGPIVQGAYDQNFPYPVPNERGVNQSAWEAEREVQNFWSGPKVIVRYLVTADTSSSPAASLDAWVVRRQLWPQGTTCNIDAGGKVLGEDAVFQVDEIQKDSSRMTYELRRLTGLSWDQLGSLLGVSRRTIHNWANGEEVREGNQLRLGRLLATIHYIDRGSADENQQLLFGESQDGKTVFDQLIEQNFDFVKKTLGEGVKRPESTWGDVDIAKASVYGRKPDVSIADAYENLGNESEPSVRIVSKGATRSVKLRKK